MELNIELTPAMLALIPVVAASLQMLKKIPQVALFKEYLPVISIAISAGFLYYQQVPNPIIPAVVIGLTACGGFDLLRSKKPVIA